MANQNYTYTYLPVSLHLNKATVLIFHQEESAWHNLCSFLQLLKTKLFSIARNSTYILNNRSAFLCSCKNPWMFRFLTTSTVLWANSNRSESFRRLTLVHRIAPTNTTQMSPWKLLLLIVTGCLKRIYERISIQASSAKGNSFERQRLATKRW